MDSHHQHTSTPFLHAKIRIGTCKGPINFKKTQKSFLRSDVPDVTWKRKEDILEWKKSRVLNTKDLWNKSVPITLHPVTEQRQRQNFIGDRSKAFTYNYRAESLEPLLIDEPIDKPTKFHISRTSSGTALASQMKMLHDPIQRGQLKRTQEIPVNVKLEGKPEWNALTSVSYKDREHNLEDFTKKSLAFSKRVSTAMSTMDYNDPRKLEGIYHATLRRQKTAGTFVPVSFIDGVDRRPIDPKHLMNRYAIEPTRTYNVVEHSGTWELSKAENRYLWSDTASNRLDSPGDIVRHKSLDTKSFFGPENLYRQHSLIVERNPVPTRKPDPRQVALSASDFGLRSGH